jgi:hypothetical protein
VILRGNSTNATIPAPLIIRDTGKGKKTIIEDLSAALRRIEHWHPGGVAHRELRVIVRQKASSYLRDAVPAEQSVKHRRFAVARRKSHYTIFSPLSM